MHMRSIVGCCSAVIAGSLALTTPADADNGGSASVPYSGQHIAYLCTPQACPDIEQPYVQFTAEGQWWGGQITVTDNCEGGDVCGNGPSWSASGDGYTDWVVIGCTNNTGNSASGNTQDQYTTAYCNFFAGDTGVTVDYYLEPDCPSGVTCY